MFIKMLLKEKRIAQLYTLIFFLVLSILFLIITAAVQIADDTYVRGRVEIIERDLVHLEKTTIANKINRRASDILFIADTLVLSGEMLGDYQAIAKPWIAFSDRYKIYDQIRFLDSKGQEKVRINYSPQGAYAVPKGTLQNKNSRDYFQNTKLLSQGKIFISEMDLNVENGEVELPFKPMLRLTTPLIVDNWFSGAVVLNYSAEDMLQQIRNVAQASLGEVHMLNREGYWLFNSADRDKEWAFMFPDRMDESFASAYPQEWAMISGGDTYGHFITENGVFTYTAISPEEEILGYNVDALVLDDAGFFYIVSYIPADSSVGQRFSQTLLQTVDRVVAKYLSIYFLLSGVAFTLAALIAVGRAQKKEIKYFSEFDAMTGVFNRRAGYGKLNELKKQTTSRGYTIAICFIDINGLKEVNDGLGHDVGDELIKSVAGVIRDSVRGNDFVSRFGGDEFLIVFDRLDEAGAERVWQRIMARFEAINTEESRPYAISISHGIGVFVSNEDGTVDEIISRADTKMYEEKRELKKGLRVIRDPKI
ncbi:MAG TPA: diguanylate cyclase [Candidatus Limiplasma sp.]|nr:diguanylate cyclase [Candidatus Limiplasma sp.]HRX08198.1 diguanylate cyclase [Candidatus Limiplasma sp.]